MSAELASKAYNIVEEHIKRSRDEYSRGSTDVYKDFFESARRDALDSCKSVNIKAQAKKQLQTINDTGITFRPETRTHVGSFIRALFILQFEAVRVTCNFVRMSH